MLHAREARYPCRSRQPSVCCICGRARPPIASCCRSTRSPPTSTGSARSSTTAAIGKSATQRRPVRAAAAAARSDDDARPAVQRSRTGSARSSCPRRRPTARAGPIRRSRCSRRDWRPIPDALAVRARHRVHPLLVTRATTPQAARWFERAAAHAERARVDPAAGGDDAGAGRRPRGRAAAAGRAARRRPSRTSARRPSAASRSSARSTRSTSCRRCVERVSRARRAAIRTDWRDLIRAGLLPACRPTRPARRSSTTRRRTRSRCRPTSPLAPLPQALRPPLTSRALLVAARASFGLMIGSFLNVCIARIAGRRVGRHAGLALPVVQDADPLVRQHSGAQLPAARRPLPHTAGRASARAIRVVEIVTAVAFVVPGAG